MPRIPVHFRNLALILAALTLLTACGSGGTPDPTPVPTNTAIPTAAPGQLTVGDLIAMSAEAWPDVQSMRAVSTSGPIMPEGATPELAQISGSVQEWTRPNNRHILELQGGLPVNEQIYVDGMIYMRGSFVTSAVAPNVGPQTWVTLDDPSVVPADSPVGIQIAYLTREQTDPYGPLSTDILARPVHESGRATVGDRSCTVYAFGDESNTGDEIHYELSVDEAGLPCQVVMSGGGFQNSTVYVFNADEIVIRAPLEGTPVSGTPEG